MAVRGVGMVAWRLGVAATVAGTATFAPAAEHACFKPVEIEADRAVRFQTELMVISDTCGDQVYTHFTTRNRRTIVAYQQRMIEHFRRSGDRRAEASFDHFQSELANAVSRRAGEKSPVEMCHDAAEFLGTADSLDDRSFRRYVAGEAAKHEADYLHCVK